MKIHYDRSFLTSVRKIKEPTTLKRVNEVICKMERLETIEKLTGTKKIAGYSKYYRIKIGIIELASKRFPRTRFA